jgi:hypothetical protein
MTRSISADLVVRAKVRGDSRDTLKTEQGDVPLGTMIDSISITKPPTHLKDHLESYQA